MSLVFLSCSHKDKVWKNRLKTHLGSLDLDSWDDLRIEGGADWLKEIQEAMARASVAILLVSADFLDSKFIRREEIPPLLARRVAEGLIIIPVIIRSCAWREIVWLRDIEARPLYGQPLAGFRGDRRDAELANIAREIRRMLSAESRNQEREGEPPNKQDDFLSQVEALCRQRDPKAAVERFLAPGNTGYYLRVTTPKDVYPVGVIEDGLSEETFKFFRDQIDSLYRRNDPGLNSILVYGGERASENLLREANRRRIRLVSFIEHQGLIDFRPYLGRQVIKLFEHPIYCPHLYVPQQLRTISFLGHEDDATSDALTQVEDWLASPNGRFVVILGESGTGKTFLLRRLAHQMWQSKGGFVPILLQIRSLGDMGNINDLLLQHFRQDGMEDFPLSKFWEMLQESRIVLLCDGFDELVLRLTYTQAMDHFAALLQATSGNAKVVFTSMKQHFLSENVGRNSLDTIPGLRLSLLQPFHREQAKSFLVNFFSGNEQLALARLRVFERIKDHPDPYFNPRLLHFMANLSEEKLKANGQGKKFTRTKFFELIIEDWLAAEFIQSSHCDIPPWFSFDNRLKAATSLARLLWHKENMITSPSDLDEEVRRVLEALVAPSSSGSRTMGSATLLCRDEKGNLGFLDRSIIEWLVAKSAAKEISAGLIPQDFQTRQISHQMANFFLDLAGQESANDWAQRVISASTAEMVRKNAYLLLEETKINIRRRRSQRFKSTESERTNP